MTVVMSDICYQEGIVSLCPGPLYWILLVKCTDLVSILLPPDHLSLSPGVMHRDESALGSLRQPFILNFNLN